MEWSLQHLHRGQSHISKETDALKAYREEGLALTADDTADDADRPDRPGEPPAHLPLAGELSDTLQARPSHGERA